MAEIEVELKNLKKILNDTDSFYQVPDYQRPYSWDKENISELIDDLTFAYTNLESDEFSKFDEICSNSTLYMGHIYYIKHCI
jgi:uncharacterized protein with ParB-like and HNH nuclease domain